MKFHIAVNLERMDDQTCMRAVRDHTINMVRMADQAGFETAWAAEHHALEMTIAPNPFQILTWWASETNQIRLGSGVANAAYWHPVNIAGEAAMVDLISGGRLEFGLGSGAYQREFDRMKPGTDQKDGWRYLQEMLPLVRDLWKGDVAHSGEHWSFPSATCCPKPQQSQVPCWVAARSPVTFDHAVANNCNVMSWPLTLPFSEAEKYKTQLDDAIAKSDSGYSGRFAMMRHAAVYETEADRILAMDALRGVLGQFGNLMTKKGEVRNGFADRVPLSELEGNVRVDPAMLEENLLFGSPETVITKLKRYEALGVDAFIYYASMGLDMEAQRRSLKLFIDEVMPAFEQTDEARLAAE
ncbi:MAG: LLM class flavin-dependent oxidoreductase [Pseudomonadota bacterium]